MDLAELAAAAALLLVPVARLGVGGDRLAVGDFRLLGDDFQVEAAFETVLDHVEVQLAHAGDDHFLGLRVARHLESRVFVGDLVQAAGNFLLVAAGLRLDRQAEHRRREGRPRQLRRLGAGADGVADVQVLHLGDGDDVAGDRLGDVLLRLALHVQQAAGARRTCRCER